MINSFFFCAAVSASLILFWRGYRRTDVWLFSSFLIISIKLFLYNEISGITAAVLTLLSLTAFSMALNLKRCSIVIYMNSDGVFASLPSESGKKITAILPGNIRLCGINDNSTVVVDARLIMEYRLNSLMFETEKIYIKRIYDGGTNFFA